MSPPPSADETLPRATGQILSDDGMWAWDDTQWQPTPAQLARTGSQSGSHRAGPQVEAPSEAEAIEAWKRQRDNLAPRGTVFTAEREHDEPQRATRSPGRGALLAVVGVVAAAVAVACFYVVSQNTGPDTPSPEDTVRAWHNAVVGGENEAACSHLSDSAVEALAASLPDLEEGTGAGEEGAAECVTVAAEASRVAMETGTAIVTGNVAVSGDGSDDAQPGATAHAQVAYTDATSRAFDLRLDAERGWLIVDMSGPPATSITPPDAAETTPAK